MKFISILSTILNKILGCTLTEKLMMAANVLFHEWHMVSPVSRQFSTLELATITDEELSIFDSLDKDSRWHIRKYLNTIRTFFTFGNTHNFFFNYSKIQENISQKQQATEMKRTLIKRIKDFQTLPNIILGGYESLVAHHGLAMSPSFIKEYIQNSTFLDIGACYGDSTLVFLKYYNPHKVIAFEPSTLNRTVFDKIMRLNNINSNMYTLSSVGLDKEQRTISIHDSGEPGNSLQSTGNANEEIECQPLDIFCQKNSLRNIRFIKADVEGMGTDVLLGAQQTIRKERPVLSLSIYHNKEELLGVFKILTSWNLNYKIKIRMMNFPLHADELTLVAWPIEIE